MHRDGRVKAVVLAPVLGKTRGKGAAVAKSRDAAERSPQARLDEAVGLAAAIDLDVKASGLVPVPNPRPATLVRLRQGRGAGRADPRRGCRAWSSSIIR